MRTVVLGVFLFSACARATVATPPVPALPPAFMVGNFEDDYGARFSITPDEFFQRPRNRFHVVRWDVQNQFLIAHNDSLNAADANKWTRIDWVVLNGMAPYDWAFCLSAYKAPTRAAAETTSVARRETPRTGCNGFPFSRMKRLAAAPDPRNQ